MTVSLQHAVRSISLLVTSIGLSSFQLDRVHRSLGSVFLITTELPQITIHMHNVAILFYLINLQNLSLVFFISKMLLKVKICSIFGSVHELLQYLVS